ncbi:MAG: hypothetical protein ABI036_02490 [Fibrobacteria bacterium]
MHRNRKVTPAPTAAFLVSFTAALMAGLGTAPAFNPIHESSYNLEPRGIFETTTLSGGFIVDSRSTNNWMLPVSLALKASRQTELGAGIKTQWGDGDDHVPYLVFGVKFLVPGQTSFQADLLIPANRRNGMGLSLASHHRFNYGGPLSGRLAGRIGFMEALVRNDGLMAFEGAFYPTLTFGGGLALELGLIGSSQNKDFEDDLAIDLQPGIIVGAGRGTNVQACVALGLAGNAKEQMRAKLLVNHGF